MRELILMLCSVALVLGGLFLIGWQPIDEEDIIGWVASHLIPAGILIGVGCWCFLAARIP